tara:strand:- start:458 stop:883 length:426 start_codon:yes stop_codon:yes gene_type:complete
MQKKETIQPTAQELHQAGEIKHEITTVNHHQTGKRHNGAWTVETILPGDRLEFSTMKRGREISCVLRVIDSVKRSPGVTVVNWQYGNPSEVMARREARATKAAVQGVHLEGLHAWVIRCQEINKAAEARRWREVQQRHAVA